MPRRTQVCPLEKKNLIVNILLQIPTCFLLCLLVILAGLSPSNRIYILNFDVVGRCSPGIQDYALALNAE